MIINWKQVFPTTWSVSVAERRLWAHTLGSASSPGRKPETGGDPCRQGTSTLHGGTGSSGSSACWTRCQALQTWTFPEHKGDTDSQVCQPLLNASTLFVPLFSYSGIMNKYLQDGVYELQRHRELLVGEFLIWVVLQVWNEKEPLK